MASCSVLASPSRSIQSSDMLPENTQLTLLAWIHMNAPFLVCQDAVPKCRAFTHQMVQFLSSLEQNGKITLAVLEKEMSKLLDDIIVFNPPGEWPRAVMSSFSGWVPAAWGLVRAGGWAGHFQSYSQRSGARREDGLPGTLSSQHRGRHKC